MIAPLFPAPRSWEITTLGDACARGGEDIQTGPFGSQLHAADYVTTGIPSIMPQNIGDNRIDPTGIARITTGDATRLQRYLVRAGDIVYSRRGDVERRALITSTEKGWLCGTGCLRIRFGQGLVDPTYASYYLGHPNVRAWIRRHAVGATMPNLNTSILSGLPFALPPIAAQRSIAERASAFDDAIAVARSMNRTLLAMEERIFESLFEPGRGAGPATAPGWRRVQVGDVVKVYGGSTPSTARQEFWDDLGYAWATPKDLARLEEPVLLRTERGVSDLGVAEISSGLLPPGTVLMSSRAPIGYTAISEVPVAINQGFVAMVCDGGPLSNTFALLWVRKNLALIRSRSNGTTFEEISRAEFRTLPLHLPPPDLLERFRLAVAPLRELMVANVRQRLDLKALQTALLPRILSGGES